MRFLVPRPVLLVMECLGAVRAHVATSLVGFVMNSFLVTLQADRGGKLRTAFFTLERRGWLA